MLWHAVLKQHFGRAFKFVQKLGEDRPSRELDAKLAELSQRLGWTHVQKIITDHLPTKFPTQYRKF